MSIQRGKTFIGGGRSYSDLRKGKLEWKEESSYYRGEGSYPRGNNYRKEDRSLFKGTCFKNGEENGAFECTQGSSSKKTGNSIRSTFMGKE